MKPEVAAAIIALGGVILSALVTIIINSGRTRYNYNQLFAETVSNNRMDWINVWRENISKFLACAEILNRCNCPNKNPGNGQACTCRDLMAYKKEFYESRAMITSRLNMSEELHVLMFAAINQISFETTDAEFVAKREYILELARAILKPEWERLKDEAKGKRKK